ncbi:MAG: preprotein translocase subunit SecE [Chitinophagales bacterium]
MAKNAPAKKSEQIDWKLRWQKTKDYFSAIYYEIKKVNWPSRKATAIYTGVVLISVAIVCLLIWGFDSIFDFLLKALFKAFA